MGSDSESAMKADTWKGDYWGKGGVLARRRRWFEDLARNSTRLTGLSTMSSVYYSAATQSVAQFRTRRALEKPTWLWRALWCLWRANRFSDTLVRAAGLRGMTPDELNVRASVLRRSRRYMKAYEAIREGLSRDGLETDTRALLEIDLAEIFAARGDRYVARKAYERVAMMRGLKPTTEVRCWRSQAEFRLSDGELPMAREAARHALDIAHMHGLDDQVIKLRPILRRLEIPE